MIKYLIVCIKSKIFRSDNLKKNYFLELATTCTLMFMHKFDKISIEGNLCYFFFSYHLLYYIKTYLCIYLVILKLIYVLCFQNFIRIMVKPRGQQLKVLYPKVGTRSF